MLTWGLLPEPHSKCGKGNKMNTVEMRKPACALACASLAITVVALPVAAEEIATAVVAKEAALNVVPKPALALGPEMAAPIQAVMQEFGDKHVLAYYTRGADRCDLVVMTGEEPGPRMRVSLAPDQAATIEDVGGGALGLTCGAGATGMIVDRHPTPQDAVAGR